VLHLAPDDFWRATPHELAAGAEVVVEARGGPRSVQRRSLDAADIAELRALLATSV
jgi:hypothetical protein